ncbi:MAG: hypothetical protein EBR88_08655 [Betaproteobacteria bacterium]|nr:hypothetical protein [Betaproteobacteria bacterium]
MREAELIGAARLRVWVACGPAQEAEAKAATAEERERASNERLSQTHSRLAVMEAQVGGKAPGSQLGNPCLPINTLL